ncbi:GIY-YIG nuclease family protein [Facklamia miroungae]|uniref:Putative endonuclease n=1 Tax=Facklamia miroungae TaxID=120956 RepID=A0A1G7SMA9_9LACT|nr:GIY-YIG nuclease family protein [Facklamia miroungae]NKZ29602.1 GIY-YIG nuclease family protein [Facklamia miroungae]SDG24153.1 putative endonuclease [Facklamia miroungae]
MEIIEEEGYYFYVLYCQDHTLYGGFTTNLNHRLKAHNAGKGAKYTRVRKRRPLNLIYAEKWSNKSLAMSAEYHFKKLNRSQKEYYLAKNGVHLINSKDYVIVDFSQYLFCNI